MTMTLRDAAQTLWAFLQAQPSDWNDPNVDEEVAGSANLMPGILDGLRESRVVWDASSSRINRIWRGGYCAYLDPEMVGFKPDVAKELGRQWAELRHEGDDAAVARTIWASAGPPLEAGLPLWSLSDTLGSLSTLAFAIPEGGVALSALLGSFERFADNLKEQASERDPGVPPPSSAPLIEEYVTQEFIDQNLRNVHAWAVQINDSLNEMLVLPSEALKTRTLGFSPAWIAKNTRHTTRRDVLDGSRSYLKNVWKILDDGQFAAILEEGRGKPTPPELLLADQPSIAMCTIHAYCEIIQALVNGLIAYAWVCLVPDEALRPGSGWEPEDSYSLKAIQSTSRWDDRGDWGHSARDCWLELCTKLDPQDASTNWLRRVDPLTGDARRAFELIRLRLSKVRLFPGVSNPVSGTWYLPRSKKIQHNVMGTGNSEGTHDVFRGQCAGKVDLLRDRTLMMDRCDRFAEDYRAFQTVLRIHWKINEKLYYGMPFTASLVAAEAIEAATLNNSFGTYESPWTARGMKTTALGRGTYEEVCWDVAAVAATGPLPVEHESDRDEAFRPPVPHLMETELGRAAVAWAALVVVRYAEEMNYQLYCGETTPSTVEVVEAFRGAWLSVQKYAATMIGIAEQGGPA
ncbi:MAG: hypothetical protein IT193_09305 [Propionibacteriaceae bacterium]|nr:hypothetical protein [Propionibacteriaceae bacterium]